MQEKDNSVDEPELQDTPEPTNPVQAPESPPKKRRGRPPKVVTEAKKRGSRGVIGRPKGDAAIINEYKARMLASPKSRKVLDEIFDAALDRDHKNQAAAWKIVTDRIVPVSVFEQEIKKSGGKSGITINITGIGDGVKIAEGDIEDAEYEEVSE